MLYPRCLMNPSKSWVFDSLGSAPRCPCSYPIPNRCLSNLCRAQGQRLHTGSLGSYNHHPAARIVGKLYFHSPQRYARSCARQRSIREFTLASWVRQPPGAMLPGCSSLSAGAGGRSRLSFRPCVPMGDCSGVLKNCCSVVDTGTKAPGAVRCI